MQGVWRFLFGHPLVKGIILTLSGIVANVFAGAYVFDITESKAGIQRLNWSGTWSSKSFWVLAVLLILTASYIWASARFESKVRRALSTEADIRQRINEELIGPMLEAVKRDIAEGKVKPMDEIMAMFGVAKGRQP